LSGPDSWQLHPLISLEIYHYPYSLCFNHLKIYHNPRVIP